MIFETYDQQVIKEIAQHIVEPSAVTKVFQTLGKPIEKVMDVAESSNNKVVKAVYKGVSSGIEKGIKSSIKIGNHLCSEKGVLKEYKKKNINLADISSIQKLPLNKMDMIADTFSLSNALIVGAEGGAMGLATFICEGTPGAQILIPTVVIADVKASITLLCRHVCQISTSYGYSSQDPINLPHILAAMAPIDQSHDEGFLVNKAIAINAIRESKDFLIKNAGNVTKELIEKEAPQLVKLIAYLAERLSITITEKELGMLIPIAGAVVNGGVNIAFQQMGHTNAKDYFRTLILSDRYGKEEFNAALEREKEILINKKQRNVS